MRKWVFRLALFLALAPSVAFAQTSVSNGYCDLGASKALVSGLASTNYQLGVIPSCTITVFLHGTSNLATIYQDSSGTTLTNPFTATNSGFWQFWAANNGTYDVMGSGGIAPNTYPSPTLIPGGGGGGGGGSSAPEFSVQFALNTTGQFGSDPNITINPTLHSLTIAGAGTGMLGLTDSVSTDTVWQTTQPGTANWTWAWPPAFPTANAPCMTGSASGLGIWQGCVTGFMPPTISSAFTAAGTTGPVIVPGSYSGNDTETWTNPNNLHFEDARPFNPAHLTTYVGGLVPAVTIKARDYGALCNGGNDDTAAINAATAALVTVPGGQIVPNNPLYGPATVELPQGTCIIRAPIILSGYGSLVGSANGTWISADEPFVCNSFGCDMVQVTIPYTSPPSLTGTKNRVVKGINFVYAYYDSAITGVHIFNQTGASAATPYPTGAAPALYQLPGVIVADNNFFALDTGVRADDCGECSIDRNQFSFLRQGIVEYGNDYSFSASHNSFESGNAAYTSTKGITSGFYAGGRNGYFCSNSAPACSGGTVTTNVLYPQGCTLIGNDMAGWDNDVNMPNCQGLTILGNGFDYGGNGYEPSIPNSTLLLGYSVLVANISDNFIANQNCAGVDIEVGAPLSNAGTGETYNDLLIQGNYLSNYCSSAPTSSAILFDSGSFFRRGVKIEDNTIYIAGYGVTLGHGLQYSVIRGNYGAALSGDGALIHLNAAGTTSFSGTVIADNSTSTDVLSVFDQAGGGYTLEGINISGGAPNTPYQLLGTQRASAAGCTFASGTIGTTCTVTGITWPTPFADSTYLPSCTLDGGTGASITQTNIVNGGSVQAIETAVTTAGTGGGTVVCQATHQ